MTDISHDSYRRALAERIGREAADALEGSTVGIAGLGGLGSNIALLLARSGVGKLVVADFDTVELSNINRQLYTLSHIGKPKTEALSEILAQINPFCRITAHNLRITAENCVGIFSDCDIIIEAFDLPDQKAMFVNAVMEQMPEKRLISGNGMAGYGSANSIITRKITDKLTVCGDGVTDVADGTGLTAARVMICAGHMASRAVEMILGEK